MTTVSALVLEMRTALTGFHVLCVEVHSICDLGDIHGSVLRHAFFLLWELCHLFFWFLFVIGPELLIQKFSSLKQDLKMTNAPKSTSNNVCNPFYFVYEVNGVRFDFMFT